MNSIYNNSGTFTVRLRKQCGHVSLLALHHTGWMTVQLPSKVQCRKFPCNLKSLTLTLTFRPSTGPPKLHITSFNDIIKGVYSTMGSVLSEEGENILK